MKELYNKHQGETGLIIGNGPSLKDVPLGFLRKYPSFGTNRIYLLEGFAPNYYVSVNPLVIEQSHDQIKSISAVKFLPAAYAQQLDAFPLVSQYSPSFSMNPASYIYEGHTVTFVCMQLAYYMGFDTVLLVGVDHKFAYSGVPNQELVSDSDDKNHFHPEYFGKGVKWNAPDLERSEAAYKMAKAVFEDDGKRIINLTEGTALEVFERGNVKEW